MQFYTILIATFALAISGAHALPQSDDSTCLRLCRDEPIDCPAQWETVQIHSGDQDCWTCCTE
ncbi:uncharacterized protein N7479_011387 [Penicillium vulpinum]|uniref:Uncharacterized protein n=1 Tax=Penicillium vulpinum TaxID=29845 RepID=A0A1V6RXI9_9EURO|nr:uncharacterized protein N7479_011387 [Penicillium vulpinum]KAJ5952974.1 hypothetical protein N7479_011387 [Penicillium vulpinum]OQE06481.1 hypothetical protein PENVUL_c018G08329 [Penicillium vulpinum]